MLPDAVERAGDLLCSRIVLAHATEAVQLTAMTIIHSTACQAQPRCTSRELHGARLEHVDHVVDALRVGTGDALGEEDGGVDRALGVRRAARDVVAELELHVGAVRVRPDSL